MEVSAMDNGPIMLVLGEDERWILELAAANWRVSAAEAARQMITRDLWTMTGWPGAYGERLRTGLRDRHEPLPQGGDMELGETPWDVDR